jgi:hypothetical protein
MLLSIQELRSYAEPLRAATWWRLDRMKISGLIVMD